MPSMCNIGLEVHKKTISYCVKDGSGCIHAPLESRVPVWLCTGDKFVVWS
jgi:hypothetical protein